MGERGIDISGKTPRVFDLSQIDDYARVISFGCLVKEALPAKIQQRIENWFYIHIKEFGFYLIGVI